MLIYYYDNFLGQTSYFFPYFFFEVLFSSFRFHRHQRLLQIALDDLPPQPCRSLFPLPQPEKVEEEDGRHRERHRAQQIGCLTDHAVHNMCMAHAFQLDDMCIAHISTR